MGSPLLGERLVDRHDHARVDFLDGASRQVAGGTVRHEVKLRNRCGTTGITSRSSRITIAVATAVTCCTTTVPVSHIDAVLIDSAARFEAIVGRRGG